MIRRNLQQHILTSLGDTPIVLLQGPRQSGKSTLVQSLAASPDDPRPYITLDDTTVLAAARSDPEAFVMQHERVAIDEVQRAPELFPALKRSVDRDRRPGRFLLTGSANILLLPRLSESLAGRIEILSLAPLAQRECAGLNGSCIDELFADSALSTPRSTSDEIDADDLWSRVLAGGFPEARERSLERRSAWFGSFVSTLLQRDVRDFASLDALTAMPRLLALLASRVGSLVNVAEMGRTLAIPHTTLNRYLTMLEALFLMQPLPAWSTNLGKRLVKSSKLFLADSGLAAYLRGADADRLDSDGLMRGALLENFIVNEVAAQASWSSTRPALFHYRTPQNREVDIVLERRSGEVVGIEVKSAATVNGADFDGLRSLEADTDGRFVRGILLYTGESIVPFGPRMSAVPLSWLWRSDSTA
jgi:uncharacterized protein